VLTTSARHARAQVGGLAEIKAGRIQAILATLAAERGACSLEHLRGMAPEAAREELSRFKGVGKKTVACTLLFALEVGQSRGRWRWTGGVGGGHSGM
jgi:3-methyladenine DNA glycosylase/8-oxoguanine DNA glycosylase